MAETQTTTQLTQVGTVIVPVSDQDRALEFYVETLGFEKRADIPFGEGDRWVEVAPADAATTFALVPPREGEPTGIETRGNPPSPQENGKAPPRRGFLWQA